MLRVYTYIIGALMPIVKRFQRVSLDFLRRFLLPGRGEAPHFIT